MSKMHELEASKTEQSYKVGRWSSAVCTPPLNTVFMIDIINKY